MSFNTIDLNRQRQDLSSYENLWLFGYGSLIYKVDFPYIQKVPAYINGWDRRFWQGSHDHRGTPQSPGRVVTLIQSQASQKCFGMAYQVSPDVFEHLDHREKNGYLRYEVELFFLDSQMDSETGLVYIADPENEAFLGDAPMQDIAHQIHKSEGPSGPNRDYAIKLAQALDELGFEDQHVKLINNHLQSLQRET